MKTIIVRQALVAFTLGLVAIAPAQRQNVNAKDRDGWTELMRAAYKGDIDSVKRLVAIGADAKSKDKHGETALVKAVFVGRTERHSVIVGYEQVPVSYNVPGSAVYTGRGYTYIPGSSGSIPMSSPITRWDTVNLPAGACSVDCVKELLAAHADPNARDRDGMTPLIQSAKQGRPDCVAVLIEAKADVRARDKSGRTALMECSARGNIDCLTALITAHSDVNVRDRTGRTALMDAVQAGSEECVRALLAAGANADVKDRKGKSALSLAQTDSMASLVRSASK